MMMMMMRWSHTSSSSRIRGHTSWHVDRRRTTSCHRRRIGCPHARIRVSRSGRRLNGWYLLLLLLRRRRRRRRLLWLMIILGIVRCSITAMAAHDTKDWWHFSALGNLFVCSAMREKERFCFSYFRVSCNGFLSCFFCTGLLESTTEQRE